ncbi:hypothetical protein H3H37_00260 [Duganella sp. LX20W]|uniref:Uncharacterized protein n=1 Tax=Rugamonas brunnea TaxID=2758569 RepID=A0A7W2I9P8_9BURK|nr:hypothetical protein [Rugamonas brunnea]MBA5635501.1 hypothetical protein [Rugamonas brunnea]
MAYRTEIMAVLGLALGAAALAAIVTTDTYALAAQTEASGVHALTQQWQADGDQLACADDAVRTVHQ